MSQEFPSPEWPSPPLGFADRVIAAVVQRRRVERRRRFAIRGAALALAASVLIALFVGLGAFHNPRQDVVVNVPHRPAEKVEPIQQPFMEAGETIAAITRQTTDKALAPSKTVLASAEQLPLPNLYGANTEVESKRFTEAAEGARAGLDPVASQPGRAMNRMLRDFGFAPSKPRS